MHSPSVFETFMRIWTNVILDGEAVRDGFTSADQLNRLCELLERFEEEECHWCNVSPSYSRTAIPADPLKDHTVIADKTVQITSSVHPCVNRVTGLPSNSCDNMPPSLVALDEPLSHSRNGVLLCSDEVPREDPPQASDQMLLRDEDVVLLAEAVTRVGAVGVLTHVLRAIQETCFSKGPTAPDVSPAELGSTAPHSGVIASSSHVKLYLMITLLWWAASSSGNVTLVLQRSKSLLVHLLEEEIRTAVRHRRLISPPAGVTTAAEALRPPLADRRGATANAVSFEAGGEEEVDKDVFPAVVFSLTLCLYSWSCNALFQASEAAQRCRYEICSSSSGRSRSGASVASSNHGGSALLTPSGRSSSRTDGSPPSFSSSVSSSSSTAVFLDVMADIARQHDDGWRKAKGRKGEGEEEIGGGGTGIVPTVQIVRRGVLLSSEDALEEKFGGESEAEEGRESDPYSEGCNAVLYVVKTRPAALVLSRASSELPPRLDDGAVAPLRLNPRQQHHTAQPATQAQASTHSPKPQQQVRAMHTTTSTSLVTSSSSNWALYPSPTPRDCSLPKNISSVFLHSEEAECGASLTNIATSTINSSASTFTSKPSLRTTTAHPVLLQSLDVNVTPVPLSHKLPLGKQNETKQTKKKPPLRGIRLSAKQSNAAVDGGGGDGDHRRLSCSTTEGGALSSTRPPRPPLPQPALLSCSLPMEGDHSGLFHAEAMDQYAVTSTSSHSLPPTRPRLCSLSSTEEVEGNRKPPGGTSPGGDSFSLHDRDSERHVGDVDSRVAASPRGNDISIPSKQVGLFRLIQRRHHHSYKTTQEDFFLPSTLSSIE